MQTKKLVSLKMLFAILATFIVLQVLGSMSLLYGNQQTSHRSPSSSNLEVDKNGEKDKSILKEGPNLKDSKENSIPTGTVYKEHPEASLLDRDLG